MPSTPEEPSDFTNNLVEYINFARENKNTKPVPKKGVAGQKSQRKKKPIKPANEKIHSKAAADSVPEAAKVVTDNTAVPVQESKGHNQAMSRQNHLAATCESPGPDDTFYLPKPANDQAICSPLQQSAPKGAVSEPKERPGYRYITDPKTGQQRRIYEIPRYVSGVFVDNTSEFEKTYLTHTPLNVPKFGRHEDLDPHPARPANEFDPVDYERRPSGVMSPISRLDLPDAASWDVDEADGPAGDHITDITGSTDATSELGEFPLVLPPLLTPTPNRGHPRSRKQGSGGSMASSTASSTRSSSSSSASARLRKQHKAYLDQRDRCREAKKPRDGIDQVAGPDDESLNELLESFTYRPNPSEECVQGVAKGAGNGDDSNGRNNNNKKEDGACLTPGIVSQAVQSIEGRGWGSRTGGQQNQPRTSAGTKAPPNGKTSCPSRTNTSSDSSTGSTGTTKVTRNTAKLEGTRHATGMVANAPSDIHHHSTSDKTVNNSSSPSDPQASKTKKNKGTDMNNQSQSLPTWRRPSNMTIDYSSGVLNSTLDSLEPMYTVTARRKNKDNGSPTTALAHSEPKSAGVIVSSKVNDADGSEDSTAKHYRSDAKRQISTSKYSSQNDSTFVDGPSDFSINMLQYLNEDQKTPNGIVQERETIDARQSKTSDDNRSGRTWGSKTSVERGRSSKTNRSNHSRSKSAERARECRNVVSCRNNARGSESRERSSEGRDSEHTKHDRICSEKDSTVIKTDRKFLSPKGPSCPCHPNGNHPGMQMTSTRPNASKGNGASKKRGARPATTPSSGSGSENEALRCEVAQLQQQISRRDEILATSRRTVRHLEMQVSLKDDALAASKRTIDDLEEQLQSNEEAISISQRLVMHLQEQLEKTDEALATSHLTAAHLRSKMFQAQQEHEKREEEWHHRADLMLDEVDRRGEACLYLWGKMEKPGVKDQRGRQGYRYRCVS